MRFIVKLTAAGDGVVDEVAAVAAPAGQGGEQKPRAHLSGVGGEANDIQVVERFCRLHHRLAPLEKRLQPHLEN